MAPRIQTAAGSCGRCCTVFFPRRHARRAQSCASASASPPSSRTDGAISAGFTDGTRASYDLSSAPTGIHSHLRAICFPMRRKPAFTGQGCWRAVVPRPAAVDCAHVYVGGPVKAGITAGVAGRDVSVPASARARQPRMPEEHRPELLAEQLCGFGGALGASGTCLDISARINYPPLEKLLLPPPWHRGARS